MKRELLIGLGAAYLLTAPAATPAYEGACPTAWEDMCRMQCEEASAPYFDTCYGFDDQEMVLADVSVGGWGKTTRIIGATTGLVVQRRALLTRAAPAARTAAVHESVCRGVGLRLTRLTSGQGAVPLGIPQRLLAGCRYRFARSSDSPRCASAGKLQRRRGGPYSGGMS